MNNLPILFLPGLLCDAELWQAQQGYLAKYTNTMIGDLTRYNNIEMLAKAVLEQAPEEFALVGLSMGGYVAFEMLRQAPERIKKIAFVNSSARADSEEAAKRRHMLMQMAQFGQFRGVTPRLMPLLISAKNINRSDLTQSITSMAERTGKQAFLNQQQAILNRIDSRMYLKNINIPALVIVGEDDKLTPVDHAEEIASGITGSRLVIIPECGHLAPLEQSITTTTLLAEWWRS